MIEISTRVGAICLRANPSPLIREGTVSMFHGYREADVNSIISWDHLDPYSGFRASGQCAVGSAGSEKRREGVNDL